MAHVTKESGRMTSCKVKEPICGPTEGITMAAGSTGKCTEKANINGKKAEFTKATS